MLRGRQRLAVEGAEAKGQMVSYGDVSGGAPGRRRAGARALGQKRQQSVKA